MTEVDVLVVGAGPHALAVAAYLRHAEPGLRLLVADPDGWLHRWQRQFTALQLPHLRSACVHHPDPDPYALLHHARDTDREDELHGEYQCPGTALFADFCTDLVRRLDLDRALVRAPVRALRPFPAGGVAVQVGRSGLRARHVVLATNPTRSRLPGWMPSPNPRIAHSDTVDLACPPAPGERVAVVGGGLTAAHLATVASRVGARTVLLSRAPLRARPFDTTAEWLGRALPAFHADPDPHRRSATVLAARGGGSVPPPVLARLNRLADRGQVELADGPLAVDTGPDLRVTAGDQRWTVDRLWLGTGHDLDWRTEPLLADLARRHPSPASGGLPVLDPALRWCDTDVHLVGGLAALSLGPAARNLTGARMAAERIRRAVTGTTRGAQYPHPDDRRRAEPRPA